jgi:hypothetical protein
MKIPYVLENRAFGTIFMKGVRPALELDHNFSFVLNVSGMAYPISRCRLGHRPGS